jgi:hypothetical protein
VVLVGASGSGKSTWAHTHFRAEQIVSSDALRAIVGESEADLSATEDAFALLETIVAHRTRRHLTTVVDTLGLDPARRADWIALARRQGRPRTGARATVLQQRAQRASLEEEGFDVILSPGAVRTAPEDRPRAARGTPGERAGRAPLRPPASRVHVAGRRAGTTKRLTAIATSAEAGFSSIWVMDHFRQIPMFANRGSTCSRVTRRRTSRP